jgi:hypothetical protein
MRKIYLAAIALITAGSVSAQRNQQVNFTPVSVDFDANRALVDTTFYPQFENGTWTPTNASGSFGFVFGTNTWGDLAKAQAVMANDALHPKVEHKVKGIGFATSKTGTGGANSKVRFVVYELSATTGLPTTEVASADVNFADIKNLDLTFASFATAPVMAANKSYVIGADMSTLASGDGFSIITSDEDEFTFPGLAYEKWDDGTWFRMNDAAMSWGMDITAMAFVVYEEMDYTSIKNVSNDFKLLQNTPNPFRNQTIISYSLGNSFPVTLEVYDATGRLVESRNEGVKPAGTHSFTLDGNGYNQGLYFYVLRAGGHTATKKMTVIK